MKSHRLPNGALTDNVDKYVDQWRAYGAEVAAAFGPIAACVAFDPGLNIQVGGTVICLERAECDLLRNAQLAQKAKLAWLQDRRAEALGHINKRLAEIEADSRYQAPTASIQINAPLALIQLDMKAERSALLMVKELLEPTWPSCGLGNCDHPARVVDDFGVGFCWNHRGEAPEQMPILDINEFDPWWAHSMMAEDRGEPWDLEYGEWPEGYEIPKIVVPGWGLPPHDSPRRTR